MRFRRGALPTHRHPPRPPILHARWHQAAAAQPGATPARYRPQRCGARQRSAPIQLGLASGCHLAPIDTRPGDGEAGRLPLPRPPSTSGFRRRLPTPPPRGRPGVHAPAHRQYCTGHRQAGWHRRPRACNLGGEGMEGGRVAPRLAAAPMSALATSPPTRRHATVAGCQAAGRAGGRRPRWCAGHRAATARRVGAAAAVGASAPVGGGPSTPPTVSGLARLPNRHTAADSRGGGSAGHDRCGIPAAGCLGRRPTPRPPGRCRADRARGARSGCISSAAGGGCRGRGAAGPCCVG